MTLISNDFWLKYTQIKAMREMGGLTLPIWPTRMKIENLAFVFN
jgi:hypothetical protein